MSVTITKRPNARAVRRDMDRLLKAATTRAGQTMQSSIRRQIPPPRGAWTSCCHLARGVMIQDAKYTPAVRYGKGYMTKAGMVGAASRKYQRIHETGGVIRARNKPYLVFQINGKWIRTKQVTIRPKRYFSKGWTRGLLQIKKSLPSYIKMKARATMPEARA